MAKCQKCQDKGYYQHYIGHVGRAATFYCKCSIGVQLQSDIDKADQKYYAQTCDVDEGTAQ